MRVFFSMISACLCLVAFFSAGAKAGSQPLIQLAESSRIFSGTYKVYGTNRNGSKYKGKAVIAAVDGKVKMSWLITSGQTYKGIGYIKNGKMVVDFGGRYPIIYTIDDDGVLHGKWDRGRASETLIPE